MNIVPYPVKTYWPNNKPGQLDADCDIYLLRDLQLLQIV